MADQFTQDQEQVISPDPAVEYPVPRFAVPVNPATTEQVRAAEANREPSPGFLDVAAAAVQNQHVAAGFLRLGARRGNEVVDPSFRATDEMLSVYKEEFTDTDRERLKNTFSKDNFDDEVAFIREDKKRHELLASAGLGGVAAELVAAILDPVAVVSAVGTGGYSWLTKGSRLGNSLRLGLAIGTESAAFETALGATDTQRNLDHVFIAAAAGAILGSGIGALSRSTRPHLAAAVDTVDEEVAQFARRAVALTDDNRAIRIADRIDEGLQEVQELVRVTDDAEVDRVIAGYRAELEEAGRAPQFSGRRGAKMKESMRKKLAEARAIAEDVNANWSLHRSRVLSAMGPPANTAEEAQQAARLAAVRDIYEPKLDALTTEISRLEKTLDAAPKAPKARKDLAAFDELTRDQQLAQLFPEGPPQRSEVVVSWNEKAQGVIDDLYKGEVESAEKAVAKEVETPATPADGSKPAAKKPPDPVAVAVEEELKGAKAIIQRALNLSLAHLQPITKRLPRGVSDRLQSAFTTMDHSENPYFRGLNMLFNENPQGGLLPQKTAGILSYTNLRRIKSVVRNRYNEGFLEWSASHGRGKVRAYLDTGQFRSEFDKAVMLQIHTPSANAAPGIKKAAEGLSDGYALALKLRKEAGEFGFKDVATNARYVPITFHPQLFNNILADPRYGKKFLQRLLSKGYQEGGYKLTARSADKLAEMQITRTMGRLLSQRQAFEATVSVAERNRFLQELRLAGVEDDVIAEFVREKELAELLDNMSNRAKTSMKINPHSELNGVKVVDILNHNMSEISEAYFREAAGGAAMASHGIKTYQQALRVINSAEEAGLARGINPARNREEAEMMRDTVNLIYGKSLEVNPRGNVEIGSRRLREFTTLIRLGHVGFAQAPEAARAIQELGLRTILESVPGTGIFRRRGVRVGGKSSGALLEPELREIEEVLGYVGEDTWMSPLNVRHDDWGEGTSTSLARVLDNGLAVGSRVNNIGSGFQAIQGGLEKIVMRGIKKNLIKMAEGEKGIRQAALTEIGWSEQFVDELTEFIRKNPKYERYNGRDVRLLNFDAMDPRMRETVVLGMNRLQGRIIQKNMIGDTSIWMNKWLGKTMTQFRTFSLVSAEKQLLHDIRGDKIAAFQKLGWATLLSYMAYGTQMHLRALGESDPESFLEERMSTRNTLFGIWNKLPQAAALSLGGDVASTFGLIPDDLLGTPGKYGFRPMRPSLGFGVPAIGTIGDSVEVANELSDLVTGSGEFARFAEKTSRLIPLANMIGIGEATKAALNLTK